MRLKRFAALGAAILVLAGGRFGSVFSQSNGCALSFSSNSVSVDRNGISGFDYLSLTVNIATGCYWTASSSYSWIFPLRVSNPSSARPGLTNYGPGVLTLQVAPNSGGARFGAVSIASDTDRRSVSIIQAGAPISSTGTPSAASLTPSSAPVNTSVELSVAGANFADGAKVRWTPPTGPAILLPNSFVTAAQLTATIPASALTTIGTAQVAVANPDGTFSNSLPFRIVTLAPVLNSLAPNSAPVRVAATVQALGSNFTPGARLRWTPPDGPGSILPASFRSSSQLQATVPANLMTTPGTGQMAVLNPDGTLSNQVPFRITPSGSECTTRLPDAVAIPTGVSPVTGGIVTTVAGTDWVFPDGVKAKDAPIHNVTGIAVDSAGKVYLADNGSHLVMMVDTEVDSAGDRPMRVLAGTGLATYAGEDDGPGRLASFQDLRGLAADVSGALYVADGFRIRRISPPDSSLKRTVRTFAGTGACCSTPFDGADARTVGMNPVAVVTDSGGNLVVYSQGLGGGESRVYRISPGGALTTVFNATAQNVNILGLTVTPDSTIYLSGHQNILRVRPSGAAETVIDAIPIVKAGADAYRLASDPRDSNILLASSTEGRVLKIDLGKAPIQATAVAGAAIWGYKDGPAAEAQFNVPRDLAVGNDGAVYVVDGVAPRAYVEEGIRIGFNHRIRKIAADGKDVSTLAGNGKFRFSGDGGPAVRATFDTPRSLAVDSALNLVMVDFGNSRVRSISPSGVITTRAGSDTEGSKGDGGPAEKASFGYIGGIAPIVSLDFPAGGVFISDPSAQTIRYIDNRTGLIDKWPANLREYPFALAYLPTTQSVLFGSFVPDGIYLTTFVPNFPSVPVGISAGAPVKWNGSRALAVDFSATRNPGGTLYADNGAPWSISADGLVFGPGKASSLRRVDLLSQSVSDIFDLKNLSKQSYFTALATDQTNSAFAGSVWAGVNIDVSDPNSSTGAGTRGSLLWLTPDGARSSGLLGKAGGAVEGVPIGEAYIASVGGLAVDADGSVYYSDDQLHRVRKVLANPPASALRNPSNPDGPPLPAPAGGRYSTELRFSAKSDGAPTDIQRVLVASGVPAMPIRVLAVASSQPINCDGCAQTADVSWLRITPTNGLTPLQLEITADPLGLTQSDVPYEATVTICIPNSSQPQQTVHVLFSVAKADPPKLSIGPRLLTFAASPGTDSVTDMVVVSNDGGGELGYRGTLERQQKGIWTRLGEIYYGTVRAGVRDKIPVTVPLGAFKEGTYVLRYRVQPDSGAEPPPIPITLTMTTAGKILLLSQRGLTFTSVSGGGLVPSQDFGVLNLGKEAMVWKVHAESFGTNGSRKPPENWLEVKPESGTSGPGIATPFVTVSIKAGVNLPPGIYQGLVTVTAPGAPNAPHYVTIFHTVVAPVNDPGAAVLPSELVFNAVQGSNPPAAKELTVYNIGVNPRRSFSTTISVDNAAATGNWLLTLPGDAEVKPDTPLRVVVQPLTANLPPGNYRATITLHFPEDGKVRQIPVRLNVLPAGTVIPQERSSQLYSAARMPRADGDGCPRLRIEPEVGALAGNFSAKAGWPVSLKVIARDNCDTPMDPAGTVRARMQGTGVDTTVTLRSMGDGRWDGDWWSTSGLPGDLTVTVTASDGAGLTGERIIQGSVSTSTDHPQIDNSGVRSALSATSQSGGSGEDKAQALILAPGQRLSVAGQNLSAGTSTGELKAPYPSLWPANSFDTGTYVTIGSKSGMLRNVSPNGLDVIVPFGYTGNSGPLQMLVQRGEKASLPVYFALAAAQPAIFSEGAQGEGRIYYPADGERLANDGNPAQAGRDVAIVCTGLGSSPDVTDDDLPNWPDAAVQADITVTFNDGSPVQPKSQRMRAGKAGEYVIVVTVPAGVQGTADVVLTAGDRSSSPIKLVVK